MLSLPIDSWAMLAAEVAVGDADPLPALLEQAARRTVPAMSRAPGFQKCTIEVSLRHRPDWPSGGIRDPIASGSPLVLADGPGTKGHAAERTDAASSPL
jgi:hypothetical protein